MKARKKVYFFKIEVRYEGNAPFPHIKRLRAWATEALSDSRYDPPCKSRLIRKNGKIEIAGQNEIWMKVSSSKA